MASNRIIQDNIIAAAQCSAPVADYVTWAVSH